MMNQIREAINLVLVVVLWVTLLFGVVLNEAKIHVFDDMTDNGDEENDRS